MRKLLIEVDATSSFCSECEHLGREGWHCALFDITLGIANNEPHRCQQCIQAGWEAEAPSMREDKERRDHEKKMLARELFIRELKRSPESMKMKPPHEMRKPPYPICPECGSPVVGAMMTSKSVKHDGEIYYHPKAVSVYCSSGGCNYDRLVAELPFPPESKL